MWRTIQKSGGSSSARKHKFDSVSEIDTIVVRSRSKKRNCSSACCNVSRSSCSEMA